MMQGQDQRERAAGGVGEGCRVDIVSKQSEQTVTASRRRSCGITKSSYALPANVEHKGEFVTSRFSKNVTRRFSDTLNMLNWCLALKKTNKLSSSTFFPSRNLFNCLLSCFIWIASKYELFTSFLEANESGSEEHRHIGGERTFEV